MTDPLTDFVTISILGGSVATIAAVLLGIHRALKAARWTGADRNRATGSIALLLTAWFVVALISSWRGFYQGTGRVPTIQYGLLLPIIFGVVLFRTSPLLRRLIEALPQRFLTGIQLYRVEGAIFLVLLAVGKLPAVFALPAGIGDVLVGSYALVVAAAYTRRPQATAARLRTWNLLGLLDLAVAVTTGFLSAPSPLQLFAFDHPNRLVGAFPLVMIPVFLVPLAVMLHLASLHQLRRAATLQSRSQSQPIAGIA